jgi:hypothetical protein
MKNIEIKQLDLLLYALPLGIGLSPTNGKMTEN